MSKTSRIRRYPIPTRRHPPRRLIPVPARRRPWYRVPGVVAGMYVIGAILALSFAFPMVSGCSPLEMDIEGRLQGPSMSHWLGTDEFGRDVSCRVLYGARVSIPVGVTAVVAAVLPGLWLGLLAGYRGGWVDALVGRLTDVMLAFPGILFALLVVAWLGPSLNNTVLAVGLSGVPNYVRVSRSSTLQIRKRWFVRAARVVGCTDARILMHHLLPNILPSTIALATMDVAWAILNTATLSFLGLGAQPPTPEWGSMINEGRAFLRQAPWISLAPGAMMALTILSINQVGDGLRAALDPRTL